MAYPINTPLACLVSVPTINMNTCPAKYVLAILNREMNRFLLGNCVINRYYLDSLYFDSIRIKTLYMIVHRKE